MSPPRTVVVGGGIVGLAAAYFLARRGVPVTVLEQDRIGAGASGGNAGILAAGHPPLPRPGLARQMLSLFLRRTHPVHVRLRPDPELLRWLIGFRRACRPEAYERSIDLLATMGWEAGACIRELVESERIECEYSPSGWLEVFRTQSGFEHGREVADMLRRRGYRVDELVDGAFHEREPAFKDDVYGALHWADSAFAHPEKFVVALADRARARGADVRESSAVIALDARGGKVRGVRLVDGTSIEADRIVLAAGAWSTALGHSVGVRVPMEAGKGYHVHLDGTPHRPSTTGVMAEVFVAVTPLGSGLRLAGTVELGGTNLTVTQKRLDVLPVRAADYIKDLDRARKVSTWCGLRPLTADGLPVIGWAPGVEGLFVATGHAMMGFFLGPWTGRLAAEAVAGEKPSFDLAALSPDRFVNA
jgi:D-amino-acid dehydrogenase